MPKIEIDENEYAEMRRVTDVAKLIGQNPEARQRLQEAVAIAAPEQAGPEIRIRSEVKQQLSGIEKTVSDFIAEQRKEREDRATEDAKRALEGRWRDGRKKARDSGYTDEGLVQLETYMEQKGIADHEVAIPAFERLNPPPEPVSTGSSRWNFFDQPKDDVSLDALMKNPFGEDFLNQAIPAALKEVRGR